MNLFSKKPVRFILQLSVVAILSAFIISQVSKEEMLSVVLKANGLYLALTFSIVLLSFLINAFLWKYLLQIQTVEIPYLKLTTIFFMGMFYSNFIPSGVGTNIVGAYKTTQYSTEGVKSTVAIFFSKFLAFISLVTMAIISLILLKRHFYGVNVDALVLLMGALLLAGLSLLSKRLMARLLDLAFVRNKNRLREFLKKLDLSFELFRKNKGKVAVAFLIALGFQILAIIGDFCGAMSLGFSLDLGVFFIFIPLIRIISQVPITFNGLAVREESFILFFSHVGLSPSQALSMALIPLLFYLILSLFGGGSILIEKYRQNSLREVIT